MARKKTAQEIFSSMTPEMQAQAQAKYGGKTEFQSQISPTKPIVKSPIDMNVGENVGGITGPSASLYGFGTRKEPTVATATSPVVSKTYTNDLAYDPNNPQDYLDRLLARGQAGGAAPTETEYYNAIQAQRALQAQKPESSDPYAEILAQKRAELEAAQAAEAGRDKSELDAYTKALEARYGQQRSELLRSGQRQKSSAQNVYSFSGFGRSSAAATTMADIQQGTDNAINALNAAMQADIMAKRAELEGADSETLAALRNEVAQYQKAATDWQIDAIAKTEEANQAAGLDYMSSLNNLMAAAGQSGIDIGDPDDIRAYAEMARNPDGSINEEFVASLPEAIQAMIRSANVSSGAETPDIQKIGKDSYGYFDADGNLVRISGGGGGGGIGGAGPGGQPTEAQNIQRKDLLARVQRVANLAKNPAKWAAAMATGAGSVMNDLRFIKNNLTLDHFIKTKEQGATYGAMSEGERQILASSASALPGPGLQGATVGTDAVLRELNTILEKAGYTERVGGGSEKTEQSTTQTAQEYNENTTYKAGDTVTRDGKTYQMGTDGKFYLAQ